MNANSTKEKIKAPRGTQDILAADARVWQQIETKAIEIFGSAGFDEIRTPIFEATNLFSRAVGESSDIVNKEMYTFFDRSDRSLTLRPENTASIVRAYIEHGLDRGPRPFKAWYRGPMFRYERPQTGRYRQFHQIGIEAIGSHGPYIDLELINLGIKLLKSLGLKNLSLHINSLGSNAARSKYRDALIKFLETIHEDTCEDCQRRYKQNPLRVLDCKVPADQKLYQDAPIIYDYFDEESKEAWDKIKAGLEKLDIEVVIDPKLVRGLDYYNHCVFEIISPDPNLGQQSTILAGGRYDSLVQTLGGPEMPACGWALGVERLAILIGAGALALAPESYYIISDDTYSALELANQIRSLGKRAELDYDGAKVKKQIDKANKRGCSHAIFYLEDERRAGIYKVKDLASGKEKEIKSLDEL